MATYTATEAAERLRVHRTTVLSWHSRGWKNPDNPHETIRLEIVGTDPITGALKFDEEQLLTAEQQTRAKRQRSHRRSRRLIPA
ncbi:hypothetical protein [Glycomyces lechevalierae]|uniref:DNA-binding protein n=2 Tax=Glycomyces TaxID=58113 RepID=A0ABU2AHY4_9ACTN|nr:hypothetical protein [Glycomyces lechevalierae]MDR7336818.1 hypothetical protein [Glycomyces lechevalierae]